MRLQLRERRARIGAVQRPGQRFAWRFVDADAAERAAFCDVAAVLARMEAEPVAPPNRLRAVHRVGGADGRRYYLKRFAGVQVKNLLRNLVTRPRSTVDAEREAAVAMALRAAGWSAPRPVAVGRSGAASVLLLAELPGESLRELLVTGRCERRMAERIADHCGQVLAAGFWLPDLSADHVFVDGADAQSARLAVLDLHDGMLRRPDARLLRRVLRRFRRSVRDLPLPRREVLRFAVRLCRAAGLPRAARAAVERLAPLDTHARYDTGGRAERYRERNPRRAAREVALLERVWPGRAGETVLDVPCGAGRLARVLGERGVTWHGADRSVAMLELARHVVAGRAPLSAADAVALPFANGSFDGVVMFRFLHHLPPEVARVAVTEAARVARRFVVVTFFHPVSAHHLQRKVKAAVTGRARTRFAVTLRELDGWMGAAGLRRTRRAAEAAFARDLWIAAYER